MDMSELFGTVVQVDQGGVDGYVEGSETVECRASEAETEEVICEAGCFLL
jgi:hypothetical protein